MLLLCIRKQSKGESIKKTPKRQDIYEEKDNTLTKVEFQVMSILWDINHSACAWDIIERWEEPKPAYTTIATYLKMLYERGYVDFFKNKGEGKIHMYVAKIGRGDIGEIGGGRYDDQDSCTSIAAGEGGNAYLCRAICPFLDT